MRLYTLDGKCNISGERIKSARTKAKLTQDQLAARLQVAGLQMGQMAISRIESGKRLVVSCGDGNAVEILVLQAPGKRAMPVQDFLRGNPIEKGAFFE